MSNIDWVIVVFWTLCVIAVALVTKRYTKSVADFLAAGRCAKRYMLAIAEGEAGLGAISYIAMFELYYIAGFTAGWWYMLLNSVSILIFVSGWVVYRYRQTRVLTMAQFFEMRYSKNFRIFCGILGFFAGIINFGIFPAVGARFFLYFCGIPQEFLFFGLTVSTFPLAMILLLGTSLFFTFIGGQITIMVVDFIQGIFANIMFIIILLIVFISIDWSQISQALLAAPKDASLVHPFHNKNIKDYNMVFFIITFVMSFYRILAWQGTQGYNCAAASPHEARMGKILGGWRGIAQSLLMVMLAIAAYTVMHNKDMAHLAVNAQSTLAKIESSQIQNQMIVPVAIAQILPIGIIGCFASVMLAAFLSNHQTYLLSWGSIFIQDVVLPMRKTPLSVKSHMLWLRLSIIGVAIFIFFFSLLFRQTEYILLFQTVTGSIFVSGAGSAIIGGLYWKRGNAQGAWAAMIVGAFFSTAGIVAIQLIKDFPLNGVHVSFIASIIAIGSYILVSITTKDPRINLDKILNRNSEVAEIIGCERVGFKQRLFEKLGIVEEFTKTDKLIYFSSIVLSAIWFIVFVVGTIYNLFVDISDQAWMNFWILWVIISFVLGFAVTVWLLIGGIMNLGDLFRSLTSTKRDYHDDGIVSGQHDVNNRADYKKAHGS